MRPLLLLAGFLLLVAFSTLGQVGFKMTAILAGPVTPDAAFLQRLFAEPWGFAVVAGYTGGFLTYMSLLRYAPIGPLFAATHLEIVPVAIVSALAFHETYSAVQIAGCGLILGGVVMLGAEARSLSHR